MQDPLLRHTCLVRVRYCDTDQMEIVHHAKYLEYFEVGRTELLRSLGLSYADYEKSGTRLPLVEARCFYRLPALYDENIIIESMILEYPTARLRIDYRALRETDSALLADGYTIHYFQDVATGKPKRPDPLFLSTITRPRT